MATVKIGIIGLGTVGSGLAKLIQTKTALLEQRLGLSLELVKAADLDENLATQIGIMEPVFCHKAEEVINTAEVDIVVELIGGIEPARSLIQQALQAGKHVVTANKALLAAHGPELFALARKNGVSLRCDASVAGGIPILNILDTCLVSNNITSLYGIINGTTNYILTQMTNGGLSLEESLKAAQKLGFAEADPTLDLNGQDAAHKLNVLASLIYGQDIDHNQVYCEGIEHITTTDIQHAAELGYVLKLLAIANSQDVDGAETGLQLRVHPTLVPADSPLASVRNEYNAIFLTGDEVGNQMFYGKGAGKQPTASAVLADVLLIARNLQAAQTGYQTKPRALNPITGLQSEYYLRLSTVDKPGVLGQLCTLLGDHNISILSFMQKEQQESDEYVHIVIMTHVSLEADLQDALAKIDRLDCIKQPTRFIRIARV